MCLIVKNDKPKIAKKDITCYKLLMVRVGDFMGNEWTKHYLSPFLNYPWWNIGETATDRAEWRIDKFPWLASIGLGYDFRYKIGQGGFHTFKRRKTALRVGENAGFLAPPSENFVVVKCTIPKGTEYYYGENSDGEKSYCSKSLKLEHIIE